MTIEELKIRLQKTIDDLKLAEEYEDAEDFNAALFNFADVWRENKREVHIALWHGDTPMDDIIDCRPVDETANMDDALRKSLLMAKTHIVSALDNLAYRKASKEDSDA